MSSGSRRVFLTGAAAVLGTAGMRRAFAIDSRADLILTNGKIATVDARNSFATTVVVRDGRIVAVGDARVAEGYEAAQVIDLKGRTVLPGFCDNHHHPGIPTPLPPGTVDLRHAYTWAENAQKLREAARTLPKGAWLRASAFRLYFTEAEPATIWINPDISKIPTRWMLDKVVPDNPLVVRASQLVVANSAALKLAGITRDTPQPAAGDGRIEKDANGEPTGVLWYASGDAIEEFAPAAPDIVRPSGREQFLGLRDFFVSMRHLGITSLNIAGGSPTNLRMYQDLQQQFHGDLPRMTMQLGLRATSLDVVKQDFATLEGLGFRTRAGNEWIKVGAIKMYLDGGYTFSRPWPVNSAPHKNVPTYRGAWRSAPDYFYHVFKRAHELGWQIGVHAAGDEASRVVTDVFERILIENPRDDHRHHIIHFEVGPPEETYRKMKQYGIGVAMQPNFTYGLQPFFSLALAGDQLARNNPSGSVLRHGLHLSFGSDERPYGPMYGIYAAVTRRGADGVVYGADEAITLEQAIRAYTIDSAWHTFDEKTRGSIEVGKVGDFVVLSEDIFTVDPLRIKDLKAVQTIIAGKVFDVPPELPNYFHQTQQPRARG
jgi:predicted amidohydrolase YtcJ